MPQHPDDPRGRAEFALAGALVSGLKKLGLGKEDVTDDTLRLALTDEDRKRLLTDDEVHALAMAFPEVDLESFDILMPKTRDPDTLARLREIEAHAIDGMRRLGMRVLDPRERRRGRRDN